MNFILWASFLGGFCGIVGELVPIREMNLP